MRSGRKTLLGLVIALLVGAIVGVAAGGYCGFRLGMSHIIDECLYKDAKDVQSYVSILKHLKAVQMEPAKEILEFTLDDTLIIFDPQEPYAGISNQTLSEVDRAIYDAKVYRSENPRKSNRPHVDAMVANIFSRKSMNNLN